MKKQGALTFLICLLMATAGCRHKPVKAIVLIPSADSDSPSVYAESGGTLEFRLDEGTPANSTFEVQFSQQVCDPNDKLDGTNTQSVTCHIASTSGDFNVTATITEIIGATESAPRRNIPPRQVKAYIRPCKGCGPNSGNSK